MQTLKILGVSSITRNHRIGVHVTNVNLAIATDIKL